MALALFIGIALANTSCSKDKKTNVINDFTKAYFPQAEVLASIKDGFDYEVTLSDYTHIEFDGGLFGQFDWDEVDCKHSTIYTTVPAALIPTEISDYVTLLHSGRSIVKIAKDSLGWEIELDNGVEIEFDRRFNVIEMD